jgi:hypothetical protein
MSITYRGSSVSSQPIYGNDQLTQNLFAFVNGYGSRVNCYIRSMMIQNDCVAALAAVMPQVKVSRVTALPTGGFAIPKCAFDTTLTSDTNVAIYTPAVYGSPVVDTIGTVSWQQLDFRMHTLVEKVLSEDRFIVPQISSLSGAEYEIHPGEVLLVQTVGAATTSNPSLSTNWFTQCVWEEDSYAVFSISGQVTLSAAPVAGAKIIIVEADDESLTNPRIVSVQTSDGSGNWASSIRSGKIGAAFVQYTTGGIYYTAPGNPFLEH